MKNLFFMAVGITIIVLFLIWNSSVNEILRYNSFHLAMLKGHVFLFVLSNVLAIFDVIIVIM